MAWLEASVGNVWPNRSPRAPLKVTATSNAAVTEAREAMVAARAEIFIVNGSLELALWLWPKFIGSVFGIGGHLLPGCNGLFYTRHQSFSLTLFTQH